MDGCWPIVHQEPGERRAAGPAPSAAPHRSLSLTSPLELCPHPIHGKTVCMKLALGAKLVGDCCGWEGLERKI